MYIVYLQAFVPGLLGLGLEPDPQQTADPHQEAPSCPYLLSFAIPVGEF